MAKAVSRLDNKAQDGRFLRMKSAGEIIAGTMVAINSDGLVEDITKSADVSFIGMAQEGHKNGEVLVRTEPHVVRLNTVGAAADQNWVGRKVYADDNQTVAIDNAGDRRLVGTVVKFVSSLFVDVLVSPESGRVVSA